MQRLLASTMMLLMMTAALAGCAGSDQQDEIDDLEAQVTALQNDLSAANASIAAKDTTIAGYEAGAVITQSDVDNATAAGNAAGVASVDITTDNAAAVAAATQSTLDVIMARDPPSMKCGVKTSQYGMGYLESDGSRSGMDVDYCKALAAAIGLDPVTDIEYILATGSNRFDILADGTIDVLIRTTTWTTSRDADLNADFAGTNFFDGQGFLVRGDAFPATTAVNAAGLTGASVCVATGTTTEGNIADWNAANGNMLTITTVENEDATTAKLIDGSCDAVTGDMSAMAARLYVLNADGSCSTCDLWIPPDIISKEPLAAATRDNDDDWNDVVAWVWYALVTAEEIGITQANVDARATAAAATGGDIGENRLLNTAMGLGTLTNPVPANWGHLAISAVGNYGEVYDRGFCDGNYDGTSGSSAMVDCILPRAGTANALVSEGGIMYAPAMR